MKNAAYGILTPAYYRLEVQQMVEIIYPGEDEPTVEPDVDQANVESLPEGIVVGPCFWGVYGRRITGEAEHLSDFSDFAEACHFCERMGGHEDIVPPGPVIECHGQRIEFLHDGYWPADKEEQQLVALQELAFRAANAACMTAAHLLSHIGDYTQTRRKMIDSTMSWLAVKRNELVKPWGAA